MWHNLSCDVILYMLGWHECTPTHCMALLGYFGRDCTRTLQMVFRSIRLPPRPWLPYVRWHAIGSMSVELDLEGAVHHALVRNVAKMVHLRRIAITYDGIITQYVWKPFVGVIEGLPELQSLSLDGVGGFYPMSLPRLRRIELMGTHDIDHLISAPSVTHIHVSRCPLQTL